ncbi:hypothetical protein [Fibrella aquatilis]|uniref:Uncharacterized protein n=1 Tax=Fibrella aquatilis TaxID=2817059 RepID=A0A939GA25_9BACT|nr:hypothetical protein [Fibrella aquatilis]MBO0934591.1 hypothetical protein [Fibrella aquatilis]
MKLHQTKLSLQFPMLDAFDWDGSTIYSTRMSQRLMLHFGPDKHETRLQAIARAVAGRPQRKAEYYSMHLN